MHPMTIPIRSLAPPDAALRPTTSMRCHAHEMATFAMRAAPSRAPDHAWPARARCSLPSPNACSSG